MPDLFKCKRTDAWLLAHHADLTAPQIIVQEQLSSEYDFEFHGGHPQGNPIYIRLAGDKTGSNIAKFTTQGKTANTFEIVNQGYLLQSDPRKSKPTIKNKEFEALKTLIRANWAFFQTLAAR